MSVSAPVAMGSFLSSSNVLTSGPIALSATTPVGAYVVVHGASGIATDTLSISDTQTNTWTLIGTITQGTGAQAATYVWGCLIPSGKQLVAGTDTITVTQTSTSHSLAVSIEYFTGASGLDGTAVTQSITTSSTTVTFPAINFDAAGNMWVAKVDTSAGVTALNTFSPTGVAQDYLRTTTGTNLRTQYGLTGSGLTVGSVTGGVHTNSAQPYAAVVFVLAATVVVGTGIMFGGAVQL